jgi:hypothetical protein
MENQGLARTLHNLRAELRTAKLRLQRAGLCPHHEDPEFGCEPCADRQLRGDKIKDGKWL